MLTHQSSDAWKIHFKGTDIESFKLSILSNLEYHLAKGGWSATKHDWFLATASAVAEHLIERWILTQHTYHTLKPKRVNYLSMEYLMGRALGNALTNLGLDDICAHALEELGQDLDELRACESDAGLGNGGLGRLAACFLDSMATLGLPAHGYGIRYDYGLFHQKIIDGRQVEVPDHWLAKPNPWEYVRPERVYRVRFGGRTERRTDRDGQTRTYWVDADVVNAMAYDTPIPGYDTETVNTLRLWAARSTEEFNLDYFNSGDYMSACEKKVLTENLTKVLYPNDNVAIGKELRLKQEYFLVSASLQDIVLRFKGDGVPWTDFAEASAIQLNDTHPALSIPELMRIFVDEEGLDWELAWTICVQTFGYTNHTLMPEALEEWPVAMFESLLPRHLEIIYQINHYFLKDVSRRYPGDVERLRRMSIISEEGGKRVRMAYLAVVGSHKVNGVAALHSKLLRETTLRDFAEFLPERFTNKTNGITPRRWLRKSNPGLSQLISEAIGNGWVKDLWLLRDLERFADDTNFQAAWRQVKLENKGRLQKLIRSEVGLSVPVEALFDVQVKRIHEYKRQLLFSLYIVASYLRLKERVGMPVVPRVCLIGGKAAPGYHHAKLIIHFINRVADMINRDPDVNGSLHVAYLPNYRVSLAEKLIPAANLSEQISTAGKEASGTGNMKFALNGALTIGTLDGANIEIEEEVGPENIFIFGLTAEEIERKRREGYEPQIFIKASPMLQRIMHLLECDFFCPSEPGLFRPIYESLIAPDTFFLMADFEAYLACQDRVSTTFEDVARWTRMSILNVARCGKFSSDRTIAEYATDIWGVCGLSIPGEGVQLDSTILRCGAHLHRMS
jgi:starch phosphorylase